MMTSNNIIQEKISEDAILRSKPVGRGAENRLSDNINEDYFFLPFFAGALVSIPSLALISAGIASLWITKFMVL